MLADAEILSGLQAMFDAIDVPPVCYDRIVEKIDSAAPRRTFHWQHAALGAAAVMAIAMLAFPSATLAVLEGVVVKGEQAIIKVIGWTPPPRPPAKLASSVRTQISTLGAAQLQVHFTIVPPAGLPSDAKPLGIRTTPVLVYSNVTHSWSKGAPSVWFLYKRSNGDTVTLLADVYDPRTGAPGRYMFEGIDLPGGRTKILKHEHFVWRNGDQEMSADEGEGLTAAEIVAIRSAMRGVEVPSRPPGRPDGATIVRQYRLPDF